MPTSTTRQELQLELSERDWSSLAHHCTCPPPPTNGTSTVVWRSRHEAFGEAHVQTDPDGDGTSVTFLFRFPGQCEDPETGAPLPPRDLRRYALAAGLPGLLPMRVKFFVTMMHHLAGVFTFSLIATGCVSVAPQEVDLQRLREVLRYVNEQPNIFFALPDTWLDEAGAIDLGCRHNSLSKVFGTIYSKYSNGRADWHVYTDVEVYCSEEDAVGELEYSCKESWSGSEEIEIIFDGLGGACISPIIQQRSQGVIPVSSYYSYARIQSGVLLVDFLEIHRWELGAAKQAAIDDVTARLMEVLKEHGRHSDSPYP